MKSKLFIGYLCIMCLFTLISCAQDKTSGSSVSFDKLQDNFTNPSIEYSTVPWWVWNDDVTKEKIETQLQYFKNNNIDQIFLYPNHGLITEYLSDKWFELCNFAVETADSMDMRIWLYDENSWPSGWAGGHVPAQMPESYNQGVSLDFKKVDKLTKKSVSKYHVVLKKQDKGYIDITDNVNSELDVEGEYSVFELQYFPKTDWYGGFSYVDLIYPGVTEKFIEVTMKGYEEKFGEKFGTVVPGIFTDEPSIAPTGRGTIKWTPTLFDDFEQRWGYKLQPNLVSLFEEYGDWRRIRHNYYELLLDLFIERWSKPWYNYTESNNLNWTGHYWDHEWPSPFYGGDAMALYAWHQVPAIDLLFYTPDVENPTQFGNVRNVKELKSVANQLNKEETLCEFLSGCGWELSFEELKRVGDWTYVLGVNLMNDMAWMTMKGRRKGEYPRTVSYHEPYWEDYGVMATYYKRLSYILSMGEQINKTLVLEPTTTAWMYYSSYTEPDPEYYKLKGDFEKMLDVMEKYQIEYDLGSENIIKHHGKVQDNQFVIGNRSYDLVVLPKGFMNIESFTFKLLKEYISNGGQILLLDNPPEYQEGEKFSDFNELISKHNDCFQRVNAIDDPQALKLLNVQDFIVDNPQNIKGKVFHRRQYIDDGQIIFWCNFNTKDEVSVTFKTFGNAVSRMDAFTGEIEPCFYRKINDMVEVQFDLAPAGSLLLFVHQNEDKAKKETIQKAINEKKINSTNTKIERSSLNTLTLDYLDLEVKGEKFENIYFYVAADSAYKLNGLEKYGNRSHNPWDMDATQYKTNVLDMGEKFDQNSGFNATYSFETTNDFVPNTLKAVIEEPKLYTVKINGQIVQPEQGEWWLDQSFGVFNIGEFIKPGKNKLTLSVQPMHIHAEIEPVYLLGDFNLEMIEHGLIIVPTKDIKIGSWKEQGLPFYSHGVFYTKTFEADENKNYKVSLNQWNGTVVRVRVNGKKVGIIGWQPYELDITKWIDQNENEVTIEVVGSLKNLLGPHHGQITRGIVSPWSFTNAPEHQPAGSNYNLDDYGLFEDFDIIEYGNP